jgi:hypothetical protein
MRSEDAEKDFRDFESALRDADFEFRQRRFVDAAPLYEEALQGLRHARPPGHPDVIYCIQHLGDSLTFSGYYEIAHEVITELHDIRTRQPGFNNADLIATKFKLAKLNEMLGDLDGANAGYADTMEWAEKSLYQGHPLRTLLYDSYAEMIQRSLGDPNFQQVLHDKYDESRESGGNMVPDTLLDSLHLRGYEPLHMEQMITQEEQDEAAAPEPQEPVIPPEFYSMLGKAALLGTKLAVVAAIGFGIYYGAMTALNRYTAQQDHARQVKFAVRYDGKTYDSADGYYKLAFGHNATVDTVIEGVHRTLPLEGVEPTRMFSNTTAPHARVFKDEGDVMQSDDGHALYLVGTPNRGVVERINLVAAAAQKFYDEHQEYPHELKDLVAEDPNVANNPITGTPDDISFLNIAHERDWDANDLTREMNTLTSPDLLKDEPALAPGVVHCYTTAGDKYLEGVKCKGFFIRACDSQGQFLPSSLPGKVFVVEQVEGHPANVAGLFTPNEPPKGDQKVKLLKIIPQK